MESLTPTGVTQIISEVVLEILQSQGRSSEAKVCLVYEEAHSLVPEWNSVVMEGDKSATNGTARAILQGRKYGMGCLLITQRTANVTKTILNQCNTIFAMRTFDDTGKDFLANYLGREYATTLPDLQERQAVLFGKASACENPVLIRLNDQDDFRKVFRSENPVPVFEAKEEDNVATPSVMSTNNQNESSAVFGDDNSGPIVEAPETENNDSAEAMPFKKLNLGLKND